MIIPLLLLLFLFFLFGLWILRLSYILTATMFFLLLSKIFYFAFNSALRRVKKCCIYWKVNQPSFTSLQFHFFYKYYPKVLKGLSLSSPLQIKRVIQGWHFLLLTLCSCKQSKSCFSCHNRRDFLWSAKFNIYKYIYNYN